MNPSATTRPLLVLAVAATLHSCTSTMAGPWSAWTWREPATAEEWEEFYPLALEELKQCSCTGRLAHPCVDPTHLGFRNPEAPQAVTCEEAANAWRSRIRLAFLQSHPDLDAMTRRYVEDTRVDPALNPSTVVERVKELEQQAKAVEEVAPTPVPTVPPKASSMPVGSPAAATSDLKRAQRAVADCDRILSEMHTEDPCVSLDSQSRLAWWGHQIGEPVDMRVCLIGAPDPFDFRLVDPRTGATTLLSLTAVNGVATATTRSGYCSGIVKVLLAPDAVRSVGNLYGNAVSVRVRGTYEGLYPLRQFTTGMEAEPTRLLIHATHVERQAQRR